mmetsp:Transcript_17324/g.32276  ORF Transcript_17324/g.32276 Transcript_17324/m.32276 type:complete len:511 (+) Transcript_17324:333-1865(+)
MQRTEHTQHREFLSAQIQPLDGRLGLEVPLIRRLGYVLVQSAELAVRRVQKALGRQRRRDLAVQHLPPRPGKVTMQLLREQIPVPFLHEIVRLALLPSSLVHPVPLVKVLHAGVRNDDRRAPARMTRLVRRVLGRYGAYEERHGHVLAQDVALQEGLEELVQIGAGLAQGKFPQVGGVQSELVAGSVEIEEAECELDGNTNFFLQLLQGKIRLRYRVRQKILVRVSQTCTAEHYRRREAFAILQFDSPNFVRPFIEQDAFDVLSDLDGAAGGENSGGDLVHEFAAASHGVVPAVEEVIHDARMRAEGVSERTRSDLPESRAKDVEQLRRDVLSEVARQSLPSRHGLIASKVGIYEREVNLLREGPKNHGTDQLADVEARVVTGVLNEAEVLVDGRPIALGRKMKSQLVPKIFPSCTKVHHSTTDEHPVVNQTTVGIARSVRLVHRLKINGLVFVWDLAATLCPCDQRQQVPGRSSNIMDPHLVLAKFSVEGVRGPASAIVPLQYKNLPPT